MNKRGEDKPLINEPDFFYGSELHSEKTISLRTAAACFVNFLALGIVLEKVQRFVAEGRKPFLPPRKQPVFLLP